MDGSAAGALVAVGVDLDPQRGPLHPLLGGEVCAETVHRDKDLWGGEGQRHHGSV